MKIKSWIKYIFYVAVILVLVLVKGYLTRQLSEAYFRFRIEFYQLVIISLINIGIGLVLGLEHLISELSKGGPLKINIPKVVFMGIPSLYFSLTYLLCSSKIYFVQRILAYPAYHLLIKYGDDFVPIFQLIFGYILITSFYKRSERTLNFSHYNRL